MVCSDLAWRCAGSTGRAVTPSYAALALTTKFRQIPPKVLTVSSTTRPLPDSQYSFNLLTGTCNSCQRAPCCDDALYMFSAHLTSAHVMMCSSVLAGPCVFRPSLGSYVVPGSITHRYHPPRYCLCRCFRRPTTSPTTTIQAPTVCSRTTSIAFAERQLHPTCRRREGGDDSAPLIL